jgi:2-oxoglutarate ferredoxin oxidoreductase subunit beta
MIYGLTKGQASPTSQKELITPLQPDGVYNEPINPLALAISQEASFVARANSGDPVGMQKILKEAILHKGFSIVDVLQPCVVFNKVNTYKWFKDNSTYQEPSYKLDNKVKAFEQICCEEKLTLGVIYKNSTRPVFEEAVGIYDIDKRPLYQRDINFSVVSKVLASQN